MTAQAQEKIIFNGIEYSMATEPFGDYIFKNKIDLRLEVTCTALWRGYIGNWEIENNKLYLTELSGSGKIKNIEKFREGRLALRKKVREGSITPQENGHLLKKLEEECLEDIELSLKSMFNSDDKVFANWFTGTIRCPHGALLEYVHSGYASEYEYNLFISIKDGVVVEETNLKNSFCKPNPGFAIDSISKISQPIPPIPTKSNANLFENLTEEKYEILNCQRCNNQVSSKFKFCSKCGTKL